MRQTLGMLIVVSMIGAQTAEAQSLFCGSGTTQIPENLSILWRLPHAEKRLLKPLESYTSYSSCTLYGQSQSANSWQYRFDQSLPSGRKPKDYQVLEVARLPEGSVSCIAYWFIYTAKENLRPENQASLRSE